MSSFVLFAATEGAAARLLSMRPVDYAIIAIYFVVVLGIGFYLKKFASTGEDFFMAGPQNDRLDRRPELHLGQPQFAGDDGLVGHGLPVRHARGARLPDRRHPGHPVPGDRDDALLLHLQDAFRARLP